MQVHPTSALPTACGLPEPAGLVTLGYGCHFGLGLFLPANGVEPG
jgi:hypothetical protein